MGDIKKSIELYELIIKRLEASGNAPNQLAAYKGSLECFRDCATDDEAMAKLAASPWYTAVAQGLALDDLEAKKKAFVELGFDDVADAYEAKLAEVRTDYLKAWDTAYVGKIQQLIAAHYNEREAELNNKLKEIENEVNEVTGENRALESKPFSLKSMLSRPKADSKEAKALEGSSEEWEAIKAMKDTVIAIGKEEMATLARGDAICVAPADASGKYSFEQLRKEAY